VGDVQKGIAGCGVHEELGEGVGGDAGAGVRIGVLG
jgi:hypothetical protein